VFSERETAGFLLDAGYDILTVQELLGHKDRTVTMIYIDCIVKGKGRKTR
jgi:site-specific recombinase XerD